MNIVIRESNISDLVLYTAMMQATYTYAYVDESIGLTTECFSIDVFNSLDTQDYLKSKLVNNNEQKTWIACDEGVIIGAVTIKNSGVDQEMSGFYVHPKYQGKGIGKLLWSKVLEFTKGKDIVLDIYSHNITTIQLYKHWGFYEDTSKPHFYRHWPEWPEGLQAESMYMRRTTKS
jgi:ribosomal protein S18 acetylase RimI-like enzyme